MNHSKHTIRTWKRNGLILREGETYEMIYDKVYYTKNCEICKIVLGNGRKNEGRCMDHDHSSGYFRQVLCRNCNASYDRKIQVNNKTGHRWICPQIKKTPHNIYVYLYYQRNGFKRKSGELTLLIAYSFINLLKKPIH
jgi:hypothetical protein